MEIKSESISILKIIIGIVIIFITGWELGYLTHPLIQTTINMNSGNYSFDIGENLNNYLNKTTPTNEFKCSISWYEYGLKCNGTKYINLTGMYCDNIIVCENSK